MIICIKMDLASNNRQRFMCHKNQPTNQQTVSKPRKFLNEIRTAFEGITPQPHKF